MSDRRLSVRIDPKLHKLLRKRAKASGRSESEIVRSSLQKELGATKPRRTLYDALNESGYIGSISGGPPDLSTNKKYMEGFGEWDDNVHRSRKSHRKVVQVNSQPSCLALLLAKTRFVGSAKGLPPDTSTNPMYMEGFGKDPE